jgi:hypothetical protein
MNVLEYFEQDIYKKESLKDKLLTKVVKDTLISYDHVNDAKQEILIAWMLNEVKEVYVGDVKSVVSFACQIGQQACFGYKRDMTGALLIPRRVIKEFRERGEKLVTDMVDISVVKEDEVNDSIDVERLTNFIIPIQNSLYPLPKIDQNIEKDLNEGESIANVIFSSGLEKRALQSKLVNLTKADEIYVEFVYKEIQEEINLVDCQPSFY